MKLEDLEVHLDKVKEFLQSELSKIRTGRASPSLVEDITVEAYEGSDPLSIKELATISAFDSLSLVVSPWDKSILEKIEGAIRNSGKGLNPVNDGDNIRVPIPALTEERRKEIAKDVSALVERAKIKVRTLRQNAIKAIEEQEENGVISEDEMFRLKKLIEEGISKTNKDLEEIGKKKIEEVMKV